MQKDAADLPAFFVNVESIFHEIKAPQTFRAQLLSPHLSDKAHKALHLSQKWIKVGQSHTESSKR